MLYGRSLDLSKGDNIFDKYASLDFIGAERTKEFPIKPRIIKTHYYYAFTPKSDEAKYIYVGEYFAIKTFILCIDLLRKNKQVFNTN